MEQRNPKMIYGEDRVSLLRNVIDNISDKRNKAESIVPSQSKELIPWPYSVLFLSSGVNTIIATNIAIIPTIAIKKKIALHPK